MKLLSRSCGRGTNKGMYAYRLMPSAVQDLQDIADTIANEQCAPERAVGLLNDMKAAIEKSRAFPLSLPMVQDDLLRMKGYRKIIVKNFIVFVLLNQKDEVLNVMRVMYHARDYIKEL